MLKVNCCRYMKLVTKRYMVVHPKKTLKPKKTNIFVICLVAIRLSGLPVLSIEDTDMMVGHKRYN